MDTLKGHKTVGINDLLAMKKAAQPIACLTAYDASFARAIDTAMTDVILVGDSLGMVVQGHESTIHTTVSDIIYHSRCVSRVLQRAFLIADMPFMSCSSVGQTLYNARRLLQEGGAKMVKIEADTQSLECIKALSDCAVPVCAHIGLLPQQQYKKGRCKAQDTTPAQQQALLEHAQQCVEAGADLLIAECIPPQLAEKISASLDTPLIGIGSGLHCDGQILVMHDVIGISKQRPKFAHNFLQDTHSLQDAFCAYVNAVKQRQFPTDEHSV